MPPRTRAQTNQEKMASRNSKPKEKPSKVTKDRLTHLLEQDINECGKMAKYLVQQSGSREVSKIHAVLTPRLP